MDLDTNVDGITDQVAMDANGDNLVETWQIDTNQDGWVDQSAFDTDGDGVADVWGFDSNQDGFSAVRPPTPTGTGISIRSGWTRTRTA